MKLSLEWSRLSDERKTFASKWIGRKQIKINLSSYHFKFNYFFHCILYIEVTIKENEQHILSYQLSDIILIGHSVIE